MAKLFDWTDTIVALATPQGIGAIGVIRVSGEKAIIIVDTLFPSKNLLEQPSHTLHVGILKKGNEILDEVVIGLFKAPTSYTGENVVEISCHGSAFIQEKIIEALIEAGCRTAKAGEFTQRAFLHGKLDLTQAEAVADVIASNTKAGRNAALKNIRGGFSKELSVLREELIKFSALIELELDFSQEDVEFADRTQFIQLINQIQQTTLKLLHSFKLGNVVKNGVQVAIIGKPNAGKSTLLNALLNEDRAIVSEIAGTTRDTIEEVLNIDGILFRLIDTAGIRKSKGDKIEDIGIERSKLNAERADIIIHLHDITDDIQEDIDWLKPFASKTIAVCNKMDEWHEQNWQKGLSVEINTCNIHISAKQHEGIDDLKNELFTKAVGGEINTEDTLVTNTRHFEALQKLEQSLQDIQNGLHENIPSDLVALDIRQALHYLGEITGEVTTEDQLDFIFSKFCIGK
ncbi:MAG: tRNA uridine-5-carboxymethylaminomethyl(34) synthesis GTPase MnmE [Chitinophagaceae bacterium]|nr:tRNA uridine-5-carboxymethylaminomethyl(34) synthesis GTPase MnmE [Chitinophagaceae bacterium]MCW5904493.1 tRNA uridine-5-carboxymethylaminomethyl(34) synthesis GTPase MnmE [Chitinophagaceae bacterium]